MNIAAKTYFSVLVGLLFLACVCAATSLPEQWHAWKYTRDISTANPGALSYFAAGPEVLSHSAGNLSDLRILDETGSETPYVIRNSIGVAKTTSWPATIRENSFVPGKYTQLVLDLGAYPRFHNAVQLQTPESDFILWVKVDASDDARTWRIVKERAPISRFRKEGLDGNQTVHYSENNARYLRVQIREGDKQFPVASASVFPSSQSQKDVIPEQWIALQDARGPDASTPTDTTEWTLDLGSTHVPISSIDFTTDQKEFFRGVRLSVSNDGKEWLPGGGGEIYRYQGDSKLEESLRVPAYSYSGSRFWRVEILNGNDAPLSNAKLSASMIPRLILFRPSPGRSYRLAYGNDKAQPPQYDLERTLHITATEAAFVDQLGPEQVNSGYQDPRPFSERHPEVLWGALALAVVALGYTALRTMRTPPTQQSS
ncbi:MAG: DUF3999 family protein [Acidobacteria bacterium]|nr:DUF3999 family protein [Acidobacteriota bacterium]MBS1866303.1 DUF3999 family protein [Acidobacteriota bacterium]